MVARRRLSDTERGRALALFNEGFGVVEVGRRLGVTWSGLLLLHSLHSKEPELTSFRVTQSPSRNHVWKRKISRRKTCAIKLKCGDIYSQRASLARAFHFFRLKGFSLHSKTSKQHAVLRVFLKVRQVSKGAKCVRKTK